MYQVDRISVGKPGMMLTSVELLVAGGLLELRLPNADAPRVADLIELLARNAVEPVAAYAPAAYEPVAYEPTAYEPYPALVIPAPAPESFPAAPLPVAPAPTEPVVSAFVVPAAASEEDRAFEVSTIHIPELVIPEILMPEWRSLPETAELLPELDAMPEFVIPKVDMPEWTPLPETDLPELVLSQIVIEELAPAGAALLAPAEPVEYAEPITEITPLPDGSVLAAAAALAELEDLLSQIDAVSPESLADFLVDAPAEDPADDIVAKAREILAPVQVAGDGSIPTQPSEAVLTLAAAALLGGAQREAEDATPLPPALTRPADLSPELEKRLSRLEVLRSCGVMTEADYTKFEAEIFELAWAESKSA